jgi:putative transposase
LAYYASLLGGLFDREPEGVPLVISDDHEGIKSAVAGELPGVEWQRCVVNFERNVLFSSVPTEAMGEVAEDLKAIFKLRRHRGQRRLWPKSSSSSRPSASQRPSPSSRRA